MNEQLRELKDYLETALVNELDKSYIRLNELTLVISSNAIAKVLKFLRDDSNCLFKQLIDITAVDNPQKIKRFNVVYHLLSPRHNQRIRVILKIDEDTMVPSCHEIFSSAIWYERETWDMFGIIFSENPDLRRILSDYGFDGHPLRKDFPLTGYTQVRYDEEQKRVVYEPVQLTQDYRNFDFLSPWEGIDEEAAKNTEAQNQESTN